MTADLVIPDKDEFRIGEVCDIAGVKPFVLRYWETEFTQLSPAKGSGGQRTYTRDDVELILRIKKLLYEERFTVAGAKKRLSEEAGGKAKPAPALDSPPKKQVQKSGKLLGEVRRELEAIIDTLK